MRHHFTHPSPRAAYSPRLAGDDLASHPKLALNTPPPPRKTPKPIPSLALHFRGGARRFNGSAPSSRSGPRLGGPPGGTASSWELIEIKPAAK
jgi:hypothetical protein